MNILVTGAKGFVGKNFIETLKTVKDGRNKTRQNIKIDEIFEFDIDSDINLLDEYCKRADFVFNFAGVNRPTDDSEFEKGNVSFPERLLLTLERYGNKCPVMVSSSVQASLEGRYKDSRYGVSKRQGEEVFFEYANKTGAKVLVYRFTNIFGKWSRPNYNSAVATFCHNIANDLPVNVTDRNIELELLYIDDLINEMLDAIEGNEHYDNKKRFCITPVTHKTTLGEIVDMLYEFKQYPENLIMSEIPKGSFKKKLYSTYVSFLPERNAVFPLKMNNDERGSFTELFKTENFGQVSVNISKPGITKGQHWHNSKWEFFIVVSGKGLIEQRKIGSEEVLKFYVSGEKMEAVYMLPGYTHNIINLSETEDLVTVMWANEQFDGNKPDTFFEEV